MCKIVDVGGELVTITIRILLGVGSEARRGGGGGCTPYIFHVHICARMPLYMTIFLSMHPQNGHQLSSKPNNIRPIIGISSYVYA